MISVRRKRGQGIVLDGGIKIEIVAIQGREVVVHIHKPREVRVILEEEVDPRHGPPPANTPAFPGPRPGRSENLIRRSREQNVMTGPNRIIADQQSGPPDQIGGGK